LIRSPFKDLPREISILVAASFFVAVGFGIVMPAIPVFAKSFGVSNAAIGLMVSAFAITRFASGLISGTLVDKFGERLVFSTGVFMVALFTFLAGVAQNYEQLLFFRAAGGLGSSMFSVAASSVILRTVDDNHRGRAQSFIKVRLFLVESRAQQSEACYLRSHFVRHFLFTLFYFYFPESLHSSF